MRQLFWLPLIGTFETVFNERIEGRLAKVDIKVEPV